MEIHTHVRLRLRGVCCGGPAVPPAALDVDSLESSWADDQTGAPQEEDNDAQNLNEEEWLCMWCSFDNLGGEYCANRKCLRDRRIAGVEQFARRKRAPPSRLGSPSMDAARGASNKVAKVAAKVAGSGVGDGKRAGKQKGSAPASPCSPLGLELVPLRQPFRAEPPAEEAEPNVSDTQHMPTAGVAAVHLAVAALQATHCKPLKAEPLSPITAARAMELFPSALVLRVEQRAGTPSSPGSPLLQPSGPVQRGPLPEFALAPKLAFKRGLNRADEWLERLGSADVSAAPRAMSPRRVVAPMA